MNITITTLFPELYEPFIHSSLVNKAVSQGLISVSTFNLFSLCAPKERIDGPIVGHGSGMVLKPGVIQAAVEQIDQSSKSFKIFFSPKGKKLDQHVLKTIYQRIQNSGCSSLSLFPARYEGMDARVEEEYADEIISIGDYVLMGGDLPAMVFIEALLRLVPGVIGKQESVENDSFSGPFVDHPHYTLPVEWQGRKIPDVLRSGNHKAIDEWRHQRAVRDSIFQHFDWLRGYDIAERDKKLVHDEIPHHYAVLMHDQVLLPSPEGAVEGTTSVTSLDIHDIARSAQTYGLHGYFIVTPLVDQQKIVQTLLDFWIDGSGVTYNPHRHRAVRATQCMASLDAVIEAITQKEGKAPVLIATSAQDSGTQSQKITYFDQTQVWSHGRPVLFIFGTGRGLGQSVINRVEYILLPLKGFSDFNHLSVRSAAAIIFDRWLGINVKNVN